MIRNTQRKKEEEERKKKIRHCSDNVIFQVLFIRMRRV